jgi:hypothetical protein
MLIHLINHLKSYEVQPAHLNQKLPFQCPQTSFSEDNFTCKESVKAGERLKFTGSWRRCLFFICPDFGKKCRYGKANGP